MCIQRLVPRHVARALLLGVCLTSTLACGADQPAKPAVPAPEPGPAAEHDSPKTAGSDSTENAATPPGEEVNEAELRKKFAAAAEREITADNADLIADALERELDAELAE